MLEPVSNRLFVLVGDKSEYLFLGNTLHYKDGHYILTVVSEHRVHAAGTPTVKGFPFHVSPLLKIIIATNGQMAWFIEQAIGCLTVRCKSIACGWFVGTPEQRGQHIKHKARLLLVLGRGGIRPVSPFLH